MGVRAIDVKLCTGCGICVNNCPMDIFRMDEETGKAFIKYIRDCQCCSLCEVDCPEGAISVMPFYERRMPRAW